MDNKKNNNKLEKNTEKMENNNKKKSDVNNSIDKLNAINSASNYILALTSFQNILNSVLPKNYINTMSENLLYIKDILPRNDINIMPEILLHKNYITDMFLKYKTNIMRENLSSQMFLSNIINDIIPRNYMSNLLDGIKTINIYYKDAIETCINEILKSQINLSDLYIKKDFIDTYSVEDIENFSEEDKDEAIENVKEIIDIAKEKNENAEQLLNKKIAKIKEKHPITITIIIKILEIIVLPSIIPLLFTQSSNEYYNNNYYNNNIVLVEDSKQDFIDNARYVIAENLNVRSGAGKEYEVLTVLKYGTVVKTKEKIKYWTKIEYKDKNNDINIEGWVYTRYLEKFDVELLQD